MKKAKNITVSVKVKIKLYPDGQFTFDANDIVCNIGQKLIARMSRGSTLRRLARNHLVKSYKVGAK